MLLLLLSSILLLYLIENFDCFQVELHKEFGRVGQRAQRDVEREPREHDRRVSWQARHSTTRVLHGTGQRRLPTGRFESNARRSWHQSIQLFYQVLSQSRDQQSRHVR